jgi:hypothetical protein
MTIHFHTYDIKEERTWVPSPPEFRPGHNPNYLESLCAGCFSPLLHLPQILWFNSFWPFLKSLVGGLTFIVMSFIAGLMGRANGVRTVSVTPREPTVAEKERALANLLEGTGYMAVPIKSVLAPNAQGFSQGKDEEHY